MAGAALAIGCSLALLVAVLAGVSGTRAATGARHAPLAKLPVAARGPVSRGLGAADPRYTVRAGAGALVARNPSQNMRASFTAAGLRLTSGSGSLGVRLAGYGYGARATSVATASPSAARNTVDYARGAIREWYANGPMGLEQGFTLAAPPAHGAPGRLTLSLALSGSLRATPSADRRSIRFAGHGVALAYRGLFATDARGRRLPATVGLRAGRLQLNVDDRGAQYPLTVDPFFQQAKLTASDAAAGDRLGTSVAVSGSTIVVGAFARHSHDGAAYVYAKPAGGWANATQTAILTSSTHSAGGDEFGYSVAIQGDTIVVGAYNTFRSNSNPEAGSVYVYKRPAGGWVNATETATLTASDSGITTNGSDFFGYSVGVDGPNIVVGTGHTNNVYVFTRPPGGWVNATQTAELTGSDTGANDHLGQSVAISGTTIVAGAPQHGAHGAVYEFTQPPGGWVNGTQTAKLTSGSLGNNLGYAVAVSGQTIAALGGDTVYVFVRPGGGWADAMQTARLTPWPTGFLTSVAIDGPTIAAGNSGFGSNGAVLTFSKPPWGWSDAGQTAELDASDGAAGDQLGASVAIHGSTIVSGAPGRASFRGAAYVFRTPALVQNPNDQLTVQKAEQFIGLGPGETKSVTVSCPTGYRVLDGSPLIQQIDHGLPFFVGVVQSESTSPSAYTFTLRNPTSGNAQAKGFVTCVKSTTTDGGVITVSDPPQTALTSFGAGTTTQTLVCPPAQFGGGTTVDPGYRFTNGDGRIVGSEPTTVFGLSGWTFTISATAPGNVDLSIRCLSPTTSDGDLLLSHVIDRTVSVPAGQTVSAQLTCPVDSKGIVASDTLPDGVFLLGHEPQPITRVFTLENTTGSAQSVSLDLLCLANTTWHVTTATPGHHHH